MPREQTDLRGFLPSASTKYRALKGKKSTTHAEAVEGLIPPRWSRFGRLAEDSFKARVLTPLAKRLRRAANDDPQKQVQPGARMMYEVMERTDPRKVKVVVVTSSCARCLHTGMPFCEGEDPGLTAIANELAVCGLVTREQAETLSFSATLQPWLERGIFVMPALWTCYKGEPANSHAGWGWEQFSTTVLRSLLDGDNVKAVLLWGHEAQNVCRVAIPSHVPSLLAGNPISWRKSACMHFVNPATEGLPWASLVTDQ